MSFGVSIKTDTGEILLDERFTVPGLLSSPTAAFWATTTPPGASTRRVDEYRFTKPGSGSGGDQLIFWTLPTLAADCWFVFRPASVFGDPRTGLDSTHDSFLINRPSTTTQAASIPNGLPSIFVFGTSNLPATGSGYGLRVFKADGTVAFDIGYKHLQLSSTFTYSFPPTSTPHPAFDTSAMSTSSSTAAFYIPPAGAVVWTSSGGGLSAGKYYDMGVRRNGSNLESTLLQVDTGTEDLSFVQSSFIGNSPNFCPVIDGALYA